MADKYLIHGATYCGTGTSSAEATSNGGTGAWNDINVLEGTAPAYGSLAAGDVVHIRSKTSGGADITRTLVASATLGNSAGTTTAPITWALDGGTIWSGINGTLTYSCPSSYIVNATNNNRYWSEVEDRFVILEANAASNYKNYFTGNNIHLKNLLFDFSATTSGNGSQIGETLGYSIFEHLHIKSRQRPERLIRVGGYSRLVVIDPYIELLDSSQTIGVFSAGGQGNNLEVIGGAIVGAGATTGVKVIEQAAQGAIVRLTGLQFPQTMTLAPYPGNIETNIVATGSDGLVGARIMSAWGEANSRTDAYYPTLNATLPDSGGTPWAWWLYPKNVSPKYPMQQVFAKVFSDTAASKTIDLELLVSSTFSAINGVTLWMDVGYTDDSTGLPKRVSTLRETAPALDTSTAGWSATTYGATSYNKRRLRITTPTAIKRDSLITVTLSCVTNSGSANDTIIVCPDFVLS